MAHSKFVESLDSVEMLVHTVVLRSAGHRTNCFAKRRNAVAGKSTRNKAVLADAENEMSEVVAKMSMAQVEVLNLQEEREKAVRETKRLEELVKQQTKGFGGFWS